VPRLGPPTSRQLGVGALDELGSAVARPERGEADFDRQRIGVGCEHGMDGRKALTGVLDRRAGHYAQKLITAETNDQVIGAQIGADPAHCALKHPVAGGVTVHIVDSLQADDVDIGNRERCARSASTIDLAVKFDQSWPAQARASEVVDLSYSQLLDQRVTVCAGLRPVLGGLVTISGCLFAVCRRADSTRCRGAAISGCILAVPRRAESVLRVCRRLPAVRLTSLARRQFAITTRGGLIALQRRQIAVVRRLIASGSPLETGMCGLLAPLGTAIPNLVGGIVQLRVAAMFEFAIAGCLIALGRGLIALGRGLIGVGRRLIAVSRGLIGLSARLLRIRERLLAVSERLTARGCPSSGGAGRLPSVDRLIVLIRTKIAWR
jgi:hypothetical protein